MPWRFSLLLASRKCKEQMFPHQTYPWVVHENFAWKKFLCQAFVAFKTETDTPVFDRLREEQSNTSYSIHFTDVEFS